MQKAFENGSEVDLQTIYEAVKNDNKVEFNKLNDVEKAQLEQFLKASQELHDINPDKFRNMIRTNIIKLSTVGAIIAIIYSLLAYGPANANTPATDNKTQNTQGDVSDTLQQGNPKNEQTITPTEDNDDDEALTPSPETVEDDTLRTKKFHISEEGRLLWNREGDEYGQKIKEIRGYPYMATMLDEVTTKIIKADHDNPKVDYFIMRMIDAAKGDDKADKNGSEAQEFHDKYGDDYKEVLHYGKTIETIEINATSGKYMFKNGEGIIKFAQKIKENPDYVLSEYEKFELSHELFYRLIDMYGVSWSEKDFDKPGLLMDDEKGVEMSVDGVNAYTLLLAGGNWGNSRQKVFHYTMEVNSEPGYTPPASDRVEETSTDEVW